MTLHQLILISMVFLLQLQNSMACSTPSSLYDIVSDADMVFEGRLVALGELVECDRHPNCYRPTYKFEVIEVHIGSTKESVVVQGRMLDENGLPFTSCGYGPDFRVGEIWMVVAYGTGGEIFSSDGSRYLGETEFDANKRRDLFYRELNLSSFDALKRSHARDQAE